MMQRLICYVDGASRGNPGPAAIGVVLYEGGRTNADPLLEWCAGLGRATNNTAEYQALLWALAKALELGAREVVIRSDSELLVRQMNGQYRVKQPHLQALYRQAKQLEAGFLEVVYQHIPRTENRQADGLANRALDAATLRAE